MKRVGLIGLSRRPRLDNVQSPNEAYHGFVVCSYPITHGSSLSSEVGSPPNRQLGWLDPLAPDDDQLAPLLAQPSLDDQLHDVVVHGLVVQLEKDRDLIDRRRRCIVLQPQHPLYLRTS
jgi:hypothetical protein